MKDQITALMEAMRLVQYELDKYHRKRQGLEQTLTAVEDVMSGAQVKQAVHSLESILDAPPLVPKPA